jgi:hypothetical protein
MDLCSFIFGQGNLLIKSPIEINTIIKKLYGYGMGYGKKYKSRDTDVCFPVNGVEQVVIGYNNKFYQAKDGYIGSSTSINLTLFQVLESELVCLIRKSSESNEKKPTAKKLR